VVVGSIPTPAIFGKSNVVRQAEAACFSCGGKSMAKIGRTFRMDGMDESAAEKIF
jgi:hypothetical protein